MTVSILVVDDESDVADLFRQRFRREVRQGTYAMHFANSGEEEGAGGASRGHRAGAVRDLVRHQYAGDGRTQLLREVTARQPDLPVVIVTAYGDDERRRLGMR